MHEVISWFDTVLGAICIAVLFLACAAWRNHGGGRRGGWSSIVCNAVLIACERILQNAWTPFSMF